MQAVIMAGGKGTRLAAITKDAIPKPMVPVDGKPLLLWQIEELKKNGITDIIMIVGHLGEKIEEYIQNGDKYGVHVSYIREHEPLGTAGAFYYLKEKLTSDYFLLVFGDVFFSVDIQRMEKFYIAHHAKAALFVHPNSHPADSDLVVLDENSKIKKFDSKHNVRNYWFDNCVNAGLYILSKQVCNLVEKPCKLDLEKDLLMPLVEQGDAIYGYQSPEYIKDIGTVDRIRQAEKDLVNGLIQGKCLSNKQACIFLDRDGTVNQYRGLVWNAEDFELEKSACGAIRHINQSGKLAIVITNQPSVARGLCQIEDIENTHKKMSTLLGNEGAYLDAVYFCPHHPDKGYPEENPKYKVPCECRKPQIGLIKQAAEQFHIDLSCSWMIGDTTVDIQTGKNAGLHTALVLTGEAGNDHKYDVVPDLVCQNLQDAVDMILSYNE